MTLTERVIKTLGGYTQGEIDHIRQKAERAAEKAKAEYYEKLIAKAAAERPMFIRAHASIEELESVQALLGGNIENWRDLLLKCRLGGRLLQKAIITDKGGMITASINIYIKGGGEE